MACTLTDCPGVVLNQTHVLGDNECGYLNDNGNPKPKGSLATACRRPNCGLEFPTKAASDRHETDRARHPRSDMTFICDWAGHTDAIADHDLCPVCQ